MLALSAASPAAADQTVTNTVFGSTGTEQTYVVPAGVSSLSVTAIGAHGGQGYAGNGVVGGVGGAGAAVIANLPVTPGEVLYVEVGGIGASGQPPGTDLGGFNGGGNSEDAALSDGGGGGGGGASDVRLCSTSAVGCPGGADSLSTRLIVAGGGGGGGMDGQLTLGTGGAGGNGGADGQDGATDSSCADRGPGGRGKAGGNLSGGDGGATGVGNTGGAGGSGTRGQGGAAHGGSSGYTTGGGGGGGTFGGGAGGSSNGCGAGGGGGGSSLAPVGGSIAVAAATDPPRVVISYVSGAPGTNPPATDTTAPTLNSSTKSAKLSRTGAISFSITSNENATGTAGGTVSVPTPARILRFHTQKLRLTAGVRKKVTLKLSKANARRVRNALKHKRKLTARITLALHDASGNKRTRKLSLKLKR